MNLFFIYLFIFNCLIIFISTEEEANPSPKISEALTIPDVKGVGNFEEEGVYKSWQLDNTRFVKVKEYKGKLYVDIREHYEKDGQMLPGKKGILLNLPQFKLLRDHIHEINDVIEQCQGD